LRLAAVPVELDNSEKLLLVAPNGIAAVILVIN
jgi:hypothetical protein